MHCNSNLENKISENEVNRIMYLHYAKTPTIRTLGTLEAQILHLTHFLRRFCEENVREFTNRKKIVRRPKAKH